MTILLKINHCIVRGHFRSVDIRSSGCSNLHIISPVICENMWNYNVLFERKLNILCEYMHTLQNSVWGHLRDIRGLRGISFLTWPFLLSIICNIPKVLYHCHAGAICVLDAEQSIRPQSCWHTVVAISRHFTIAK